MGKNLEDIIFDLSKQVDNISNYYGGLLVAEYEGKYYWGIENWKGTDFREIPKYLYESLIRHDKELEEVL